MARNYDSLYKKNDVEMLQDADNAITECGLWDWLKEYEPEDGKGFLLSRHPNLERIDSAMKYGGHSGSSHAWVMRQMEYIAKNGWDSFCALRNFHRQNEMADQRNAKVLSNVSDVNILNPLRVAELLRDKLPDGEQQYGAMKKFSEGNLSYAEMRALCG